MPELPEVETIANGVHQRVHGQRIEAVWLSSRPEPFKTQPPAMAAVLNGACIERVHRVGKHIVFDLVRDPEPEQTGRDNDLTAQSREPQWIVHLGMTGRLLVVDRDVPRPTHTHAVLSLSSGRELRFVDARRFGRLSIHAAPTGRPTEQAAPMTPGERPSQTPRFQGSGREPLTISRDDFAALFRGRKLAIKAALLNQGLLQGVGNIYADESLFRAGIRPSTPAGRIARARLDKLHAALQSVLRTAIDLGGSSVSDYVDAAGVRGFFQLEHRVYGKRGEPCSVCATPIRRTIIGGRSTHACPRCQR